MANIHIKTVSEQKIEMVRSALDEGVSAKTLADALGLSITMINSMRRRNDDAHDAENTRKA